MQPSLEIQQYGDFFEVVYRDGVDPGCFKFYGNAQQVHDDILFRIGKLWIDIDEIVCENSLWQKIFNIHSK